MIHDAGYMMHDERYRMHGAKVLKSDFIMYHVSWIMDRAP
jgi:hypothetical protein